MGLPGCVSFCMCAEGEVIAILGLEWALMIGNGKSSPFKGAVLEVGKEGREWVKTSEQLLNCMCNFWLSEIFFIFQVLSFRNLFVPANRACTLVTQLKNTANSKKGTLSSEAWLVECFRSLFAKCLLCWNRQVCCRCFLDQSCSSSSLVTSDREAMALSKGNS